MGDIVQLVDGGTATTIEKQSAVGTSAIDLVYLHGLFVYGPQHQAADFQPAVACKHRCV